MGQMQGEALITQHGGVRLVALVVPSPRAPNVNNLPPRLQRSSTTSPGCVGGCFGPSGSSGIRTGFCRGIAELDREFLGLHFGHSFIRERTGV